MKKVIVKDIEVSIVIIISNKVVKINLKVIFYYVFNFIVNIYKKSKQIEENIL